MVEGSRVLKEQVLERLQDAENLYQKLVLVVGLPRSEDTQALEELAEDLECPLINLSLELSTRLLDLTEKQRSLQASTLLSEILEAAESGIVLIDRIELLFHPSLRLDPLTILQNLSRNVCLVVNWPGTLCAGSLTYASSTHPEFRRYPTAGLVIVAPPA